MSQPDTTVTPAADSNDDAEFAKLIALAQAEDDGRPAPSDAPDDDAPEGDDGDDDANKNNGKSPASDSPDQPKPADKTKNPDPAKKDDAKPDQPGDKSPYAKEKESRQKSEEDRRNRSWQKLDEEKAKFREEQDRFARERSDFETRRKPVSVEPSKDEHGRTAQDYAAAAQKFREEGSADLAAKAEARAKALGDRDAEAKRKAESDAPPSYNRAAEIHDAMEKDESLRDVKNPVVVHANDLLNGEATKDFFARPGGVQAAIGVAKLRVEAGAAAELRKKVGELEAEVKRLTEATALPGAPGQRREKAPPRKFEELSPDEQYAELQRQAAEEDGLPPPR